MHMDAAVFCTFCRRHARRCRRMGRPRVNPECVVPSPSRATGGGTLIAAPHKVIDFSQIGTDALAWYYVRSLVCCYVMLGALVRTVRCDDTPMICFAGTSPHKLRLTIQSWYGASARRRVTLVRLLLLHNCIIALQPPGAWTE